MLASVRGLVLGLVVALLSGCALLGERPAAPEVSLANISLQDATLFEQRYLLTLRIQNPNPFALPIGGMQYQLDINGEAFAHGVSDDKVSVPAYGEELIRVEVVSNLARAWRRMMDWAEGGADSLSYSLSGRAYLTDRSLRVPFEYSGELDLRGERSR